MEIAILHEIRNYSRGIVMSLYITLLAAMFFATPSSEERNDPTRMINYKACWYASVYFFLTLVGFFPPQIIHTVSGRWTAPPFNYNHAKRMVVESHVLPAALWLLGSTVQIWLTTSTSMLMHQILGFFLILIVFAFIFTSFYSAHADLSPLGRP